MKRNARLLLVAVVGLSGCGGGSQQTTPPAIVVTITTAPPASLPIGGTAGVAATVVNDTAGAGVTWSCTPSTTCGSFTPPSTASGASTTYTAPAVAPAGGSVVIIATSVTDPTKNAQSAAVTITGTASNASLNGKYVLHLTAATGNQGTGVIAASVTADGNGLITGGVEELTAPGFYDLVDIVTDGTYSIDASSHGTMRIHTANL